VIGNFRKGDMVQAVVTEIDTEKERISLSIKAVDGDPFADAIDGVKRGSIITVEVTAIEDGGIEVEYNGMKSFIRRSDLSRDRAEQRPERFQVGDKVDVRVTNVDSTVPPSGSVDQGARDRRRKGSRGTVRLLGQRCVAGRYPGRCAQQRRLSAGATWRCTSEHSKGPRGSRGPFSIGKGKASAKTCG
jgi:predicted RNA-binding protein with RPS1 domain